MVGEDAAHNGARSHHDVGPQFRAREDHDTGSEPTAGSDPHRDIARPLPVDDHVGVLVSVVLVGDVHVGTGVDVVPDLHVEVADDMTPPADHASVADADDRIGDHELPRHHPGGDAHVWPDQRVGPDGDPLLTEDRPGREGQAAPLAEASEPPGRGVTGAGGTVFGQPPPTGVNGGIEPPTRRLDEGAANLEGTAGSWWAGRCRRFVTAGLGSSHRSTLSDRSSQHSPGCRRGPDVFVRGAWSWPESLECPAQRANTRILMRNQ